MANGLVYLRPKRVVYQSAFGPFRHSARAAWGSMIAWMNENGIRREVTSGYGLALYCPENEDSKKQRYEACIELPPSIAPEDTRGVRFQELPGGAYVRRRHVGSVELLGDAIRELRGQFASAHGLSIDPRRPLVEIYINDATKVPSKDIRVDLCLPVSTG